MPVAAIIRGQAQVAWLTRCAAHFERAPSAPCRSRWRDGACDHRRSRLVEHTLRAAVLHAEPTPLPLALSILTGVLLHVRRRLAGVLIVFSTLAVIRRGRGCFAAAAVAVAQLPHHHTERFRRHACHARGPGPVPIGIVALICSPRRTRDDLFAAAHHHRPRASGRYNSWQDASCVANTLRSPL